MKSHLYMYLCISRNDIFLWSWQPSHHLFNRKKVCVKYTNTFGWRLRMWIFGRKTCQLHIVLFMLIQWRLEFTGYHLFPIGIWETAVLLTQSLAGENRKYQLNSNGNQWTLVGWKYRWGKAPILSIDSFFSYSITWILYTLIGPIPPQSNTGL